jgi:cytochrome P450
VVKGIQIDEGLVVAVDYYSIHFNPEYWGAADPNEFYPLRFKDPNVNKQAFMP